MSEALELYQNVEHSVQLLPSTQVIVALVSKLSYISYAGWPMAKSPVQSELRVTLIVCAVASAINSRSIFFLMIKVNIWY